MRRFIIRFILAIIGTWLAPIIIPGIISDNDVKTYILMGLFVACGEIILFVLQGGAAIILFFVPRPLRNFILRMAVVAVCAGLVTGLGFSPPISSQLIGLGGATLVYSLLFLLPFSS